MNATVVALRRVDRNVCAGIAHNKKGILSLSESKTGDAGGCQDRRYWYGVGKSMYNKYVATCAGPTSRARPLSADSTSRGASATSWADTSTTVPTLRSWVTPPAAAAVRVTAAYGNHGLCGTPPAGFPATSTWTIAPRLGARAYAWL